MIDPAALSNARLRHVAAPLAKAQPKISERDEKKEFDSYFQRVREADLESWYPTLKHLTYPTTFLPITVDEARSIISRYKELSVFLLFLVGDNNLMFPL